MEWRTETTELASGVFAYVQAQGGLCVANAGLIAGRAGTTAIDALFTPRMTQALRDENERVTDRPITRLVNTHHHVDHTLGNALFPPETEIVAHARAKTEMQRVGLGVLDTIRGIAPRFVPELEGISTQRLPDSTFEGDALDLDCDGRRLRLTHYGSGHTRGDVLVHLPDERILFLGDIGFFYVTPLGLEGHFGRWIAVVQRILHEIDADLLVPGHGPVGTKDDLRATLGYLELVHAQARRAFDAGLPVAEAWRSIDLGEYAAWVNAERIAPNVGRCYQEFRGEIEE